MCGYSADSPMKVQPSVPMPKARQKGARYTPISKRQDRPDAIAWLLRNYPELSDAQISRLIGTTKPTIAAVRDRTHWNSPNIKPRSPVLLGLCTQRELEEALATVRHLAPPEPEEEAPGGLAPEPEAEAELIPDLSLPADL